MHVFNWNDYVEIDLNAPTKHYPGCKGSIIGFEPWINEEGEEVWTVELDSSDNNLSDLQIPKQYIRLINKADPKIEKHE